MFVIYLKVFTFYPDSGKKSTQSCDTFIHGILLLSSRTVIVDASGDSGVQFVLKVSRVRHQIIIRWCQRLSQSRALSQIADDFLVSSDPV